MGSQSDRFGRTLRHSVAAAVAAAVCGGALRDSGAAELPEILSGANARFSGASLPSIVNGGRDMVIEQTAERATLHWRSFDIAAGHSVEFRQPSETSVALNRIFDSVPSRIEGALTANGQVYLINQNGILFASGAQVDVHSLVASTLEIDDRIFNEIGFVNAIREGDDPGDALAAFDSLGRPMGEIRIEAGAVVETAEGGRVLVLAPTITNAGTIRSPEGQVVLGASQDKVWIAPSGDNDLRGLIVEVDTGGDVTNLGQVIAERGNVTMVGLAVNQDGVARATTSVSLNGSVRLLARDMEGNGAASVGTDRRPNPERAGDLRLGASSATGVLPDDSDGAAIDALTQPLSEVELVGRSVRLAGGAHVTAPGGRVEIEASLDAPDSPLIATPGDPDVNGIEIVIETGAVIDVSGDDTTEVSVDRNLVDVEARGNELADSPLQRDGVIRNETLRVDIREGTGFLIIGGAAGNIERSAAERLSAGGSVALLSEGAVAVADGAAIDVGGGRVTYTPARIDTSRLETADGRIVDISQADPNQTYRGVISGAWLARRDPGYVEGRDAGSLQIEARGIAFDGTFEAGTVVGVNQRLQPGSLGDAQAFTRPFDQRPAGGELSFSLVRSGKPILSLGAVALPDASATIVGRNLVADSGITRLLVQNAGPVVVSEDLEMPAWSDLNLTGTGVSVDADVRIPGGSVTASNANSLKFGGESNTPNESLLTTVDGRIDVSGTWVNDNPELLAGSLPTAPIVLDGGRVDLGSGATLRLSDDSVVDAGAGAWLDGDGKLHGGDGGTIVIANGAIGDSRIAPELRIGAELRAFGFGAGGTLDITTGRVRVTPSTAASGVTLDGAELFSMLTVGTPADGEQSVLGIDAGAFARGGFRSFAVTSTRTDLEVMPGAVVNVRTANLDFADPAQPASMTTQISGNRLVSDRPATLAGAPLFRPTGTVLGELATVDYRPVFERAPAQLALTANSDLGGAIGAVADLSIAAGAAIVTDAGGSVSLASETSLFIDGAIRAPAGDISVVQAGGSSQFLADRMVWLGPGAELSANGVALVDPFNEQGLLRGEVLNGGIITVRADRGSIVGAFGARISADGTAQLLDIGTVTPGRTEIGSAGGTLSLVAGESLIYSGSLSAAAGSAAVEGGRLVFGIDARRRGLGDFLIDDGASRGPHVVIVDDFGGALPGRGAAVDEEYRSTGWVPVSQLASAGFDALELVAHSSAETAPLRVPVPDTADSLPVIEFVRDTDLSMGRSIALGTVVLRSDAAQVSLTAPVVSLGSMDTDVQFDGAIPDKRITDTGAVVEATDAIRLTPTPGDGRLLVSADLIEINGEVVTHGFGRSGAQDPGVSLVSSGDVRVNGIRYPASDRFAGLLRVGGDLAIEARRLYPSTLTEFEIGAEGVDGLVRLGGGAGDTVAAPLSVGGSLTLNADTIEQGGALFAPLGSLNLNAVSELRFTAGSLTSTSAFGIEAPFLRTEPGGSLVLPVEAGLKGVFDQLEFVETVDIAQFQRELPTQQVRLDAPAIDLQPGALFDLSGGGDVRSTEFVPGPGGTRDILLADLDTGTGVEVNDAFAILPGIGEFAPWDPLESPAAAAVQDLRVGDTLVLEEGIDGLPAGEYAILPARYALFGGFLVTPEPGTRDLRPGDARLRLDGAPVLAGRFGVAGSEAADARSRGFAVESGAVVRARAEYLETPIDALYVDGVVRAPADAGSLSINAGDALRLQGRIVSRELASGLGSAVDIATDAALSVVGESSGAGGIELRAVDLADLGADSLLIGGTRTRTADGTVISAVTDELVVEAGVSLDVPELLLVGDAIDIRATDAAATQLRSGAAADGDTARLIVEGDAAFVAVSDRGLDVDRSGAPAIANSSLTVDANVTLGARGGIVLDAGGDVTAAGTLDIQGGSVSLGASTISLGETDGLGLSSGLILSTADLVRLGGSDLRLRSSGTVTIFGGIDPDLVTFDRLLLDAPAIVGRQNEGAIARLAAGTLELTNRSGSVLDGATAPASGSGSRLALQAADLRLGDGRVDVAGFEWVSIAAGAGAPVGNDGAPALQLVGDHVLAVDGALDIDAPVITAAQAVDGAISATGSVTVTGGNPDVPPVSAAGLASGLTIRGSAIDFGGRVVLPTGTFSLRQVGDVNAPPAVDDIVVRAGASVDVAGRTLDFSPAQVGTGGGEVSIIAGTGDIVFAGGPSLPGAHIDVSGSAIGGAAGTVSLVAANGTLTVAPAMALVANAADGRSGRVTVDVGRLADDADPLGALNTLFDADGFAGARRLRVRDGDLVVGADLTIAAGDVQLVADRGRIDIAGVIDASGTQAGTIMLAAGDAIDVSGRLAARGEDPAADGGRIDLFALDADGDDPTAASDFVNLRAGAEIDVSGGAAANGGAVYVHTRRLDSDADRQTDRLVIGELLGQVTGAVRADVVATATVVDPNGQVVDAGNGDGSTIMRATITGADTNAWRSDAATFLQNAPTDIGSFTVVPGLAVVGTGDLVLATDWNFNETWHFGRNLSDPLDPEPGVAGAVTLRAARHIGLDGNLTDAFATVTTPFFDFFTNSFITADQLVGGIERRDIAGNVVETLVPEAWRYLIAAGSDLSSADPLACGAASGDLRLNDGVVVRTGAGDIDMSASGNIAIGDGAAVYAAGWNIGTAPVLDDLLAPIGLDGDSFFLWVLNGGQFPVDGGNVAIRTLGDLRTATPAGSITNWLTRIGADEISANPTSLYNGSVFGAVPTHWGVVFGQFGNGIGAFGGGSARIEVGGDMTDVVIALPTSGRVIDGYVLDTSSGLAKFEPAERTFETLGGGSLDVTVGGDFGGGQVVLGRGRAQIRSGGDTGPGALDEAPRIFVGADARVDWQAAGDLTIGGIQDPTTVPLSESQLGILKASGISVTVINAIDNFFYTYTGDSATALSSLGGDVRLDGPGFGDFLPPNVSATSAGGDTVVIPSRVEFFPAPTARLEFFARDDIRNGGGQSRLVQSDQDAALLPTAARPGSGENVISEVPLFASTPVHANDDRPNLFVAQQGSIFSDPGASGFFWTIELAKESIFSAGSDIGNLSVRVQHATPGSASSFIAGGDIDQQALRNDAGRFKANDSRIFEIWGPGSAEFVAGGSISLGTSQGIETIGNQENSVLPGDGADLLLLAGLGGEPAYDRFIDVYLSEDDSAYRDALNAFMVRIDAGRAGFATTSDRLLQIEPGAYLGELAAFLAARAIAVPDGDAVAAFRALDQAVQRQFISNVVFRELADWGAAAETPDRADRLNYVRGFAALDTLFEAGTPLAERAGEIPAGQLEQSIGAFLAIGDAQSANDVQIALFGELFPDREPAGDISLLLSQVQTIAGGDLAMLVPGGSINAGAANADIITKRPEDLGIVTARGGDIDIFVDRDLLVNSTRAFALQGDLLVWSSNGSIDAGKGAKTVTSVPDPITKIDDEGNTIIEFPPVVSGSGLQGENAFLFAPRGAVNAGDAGIRTSGNLTIGAVEVIGGDNIDVGGVAVGVPAGDAVAVTPPGVADSSSAATKSAEDSAGMLGDENEFGERVIEGTEVTFITVDVLGFGDPDGCDPDDEDC